MKKILIIRLTLIFVFYIGTSMSLALIIDLFDWAFYVDGTIYKFTKGDTIFNEYGTSHQPLASGQS